MTTGPTFDICYNCITLQSLGDNSIVYVCEVVGFCVFPGSQGGPVQGGSRTVRRTFNQFKLLLSQVRPSLTVAVT